MTGRRSPASERTVPRRTTGRGGRRPGLQSAQMGALKQEALAASERVRCPFLDLSSGAFISTVRGEAETAILGSGRGVFGRCQCGAES